MVSTACGRSPALFLLRGFYVTIYSGHLTNPISFGLRETSEPFMSSCIRHKYAHLCCNDDMLVDLLV